MLMPSLMLVLWVVGWFALVDDGARYMLALMITGEQWNATKSQVPAGTDREIQAPTEIRFFLPSE